MDEIVLPASWLEHIGFSSNPFSTREAAEESENDLIRYFIPHPAFSDVIGSGLKPRSSLLIADRGCGKTTSRRVIEWQCRAGRMDAPVLAVAYTEFSEALARCGARGEVDSAVHVGAIITIGLHRLLDSLVAHPSRAGAFIGGLQEELGRYLHHYTPLLGRRAFDRWLRIHNLLGPDAYYDALREGTFPDKNSLMSFLSQLLQLEPGTTDPRHEPAVAQLSGFVELLQTADIQTLYCLVDRIDEREPMASDPAQAAALLADLVTNLPLMDMAHVAFKLFLTPPVLAALEQRPGFRRDRLLIRDISWSPIDLQEMLDRRVEVFSSGRLPSLDAVSETGQFVPQMASAADGSPRNMLRLSEWLLYWHNRRVGSRGDFLLTKNDLTRALESFARENERRPLEEDPPLLAAMARANETAAIFIDDAGATWRGGRLLGYLPKKEHRLLQYLLLNERRMLTYEQLGEAVHGSDFGLKGLTDASIDKLVQRLRARLELGPIGSKVIRKLPSGDGYVFEQPRE